MAQASVTTNPTVLVSNAAASKGANTDYAVVTFPVKDRSKAGVIYVEKTSAACTVANFEPGETLYAQLASGGPPNLDVLEFGR